MAWLSADSLGRAYGMRGNAFLHQGYGLASVLVIVLLACRACGATMWDELIQAACTKQCATSDLPGIYRDRCAIWHQAVLLLLPSVSLPPCTVFVDEVDVCVAPIPGLKVQCDVSQRVGWLSGKGVLLSDHGSSTGRVSRPSMCSMFWEGSLSPALAHLDKLRLLDLASPPRYATIGTSNEDVVPLIDAMLLAKCTQLNLQGSNISGGIPEVWGQLSVNIVDISGNQGLTGDIPATWMSTVRAVKVNGTRVNNHHHTCQVNCFTDDLTGPQRDRCGLWYQLRGLQTTEWLPPCESYIKSSNNVCTGTGWEQTLQVDCEEDRVTKITAWASFRNTEGLPVLPDHGLTGGSNCTAFYEGTLAPEIGAVSRLRELYFYSPTVAMYLPGTTDINQSLLNCTGLTWTGGNLSGYLPTQWGKLEHLEFLEISGNRLLSGQILPGFLVPEGGVKKSIYVCDSKVKLPQFATWEKDKVCKASQRRNGSLYLYGSGKGYYFGLNIEKAEFESGLVFGPWIDSSLSEDGIFYCGKHNAVPQAAAVWSAFLVMMLLILFVRWRVWKMQKQRRVEIAQTGKQVLQKRQLSTCWSGIMQLHSDWYEKLHNLIHKYKAPCFALVTFYDLITDVLLAVSMYPSWTTWFVMVGCILPDVILSVTIAVQGIWILRRRYPAALVVLLTPIFFLTTFTCFPFLVIYLVLEKMFGWRKVQEGLTSYWFGLNIDRLAMLYSGVTACTEDVFITVFTTIGFVLMAKAPWKVNKTNIYFALWSFWLSMITAMVHMLMSWWEAVGNYLEYGGFRWVKGAFTELHLPEGPSAKGAGRQPGNLEESTEWPAAKAETVLQSNAITTEKASYNQDPDVVYKIDVAEALGEENSLAGEPGVCAKLRRAAGLNVVAGCTSPERDVVSSTDSAVEPSSSMWRVPIGQEGTSVAGCSGGSSTNSSDDACISRECRPLDGGSDDDEEFQKYLAAGPQ